MKSKMKRTTTATMTAFLMTLWAGEAWALQSHGPPEGIYVHQMAHLLFMGALAYLFWHTRRTQDLGSNGWRYLQIFCVLLFFWNLVAFTGHEMLSHLSGEDLLDKNTWHERLASPLNSVKLLYYITKMDHFLFAPGFFSLMISLRSFYREALMKEGK
jgi:hypothetical protein